MSDTARTIAPFLGFAALLRRSDVPVAPEQTMAWLAAIELLGPTGMGDIRRAVHAILAPQPERFAEFDALFNAHFLGALVPGLEAEPSDEEPPRAADDSAGGPEPIFGEDTHESGAKATGAERLAARRFAPGSEDETLRRFARDLPARVPMCGGCFVRPCAMPASSSTCAGAGAGCGSAGSSSSSMSSFRLRSPP